MNRKSLLKLMLISTFCISQTVQAQTASGVTNLVCKKVSGNIVDVMSFTVPPDCSGEGVICSVTDSEVSVTIPFAHHTEKRVLDRYSGVLTLARCIYGINDSLGKVDRIATAKANCAWEGFSNIGQAQCEVMKGRKF